jgi:hypothetical protein
MLRAALGRAVGHPARDVLADARHGADADADEGGADDVPCVLRNGAEVGHDAADLRHGGQPDPVLQRLDDLRDGEGADQDGYDLDADVERRQAEGKARVEHQGIATDGRERDPDQPGDPALVDQILAGERARDDDAEQGQQAEFVGGELQRQLGDQGRAHDQREHAHDRADERGRRGHAERAAALALLRQRVAVHGRGGRGGRAGDVQEDGRVGAAINGADIHGDQRDQRRVEAEAVGERGQEADAERGRQARQGAEDDTEQAGAEQDHPVARVGEQVAECGEELAEALQDEHRLSRRRAACSGRCRTARPSRPRAAGARAART